jgi:alcohol dehydrogenase
MKAAQFKEYGPAENMMIVDIDRPAVRGGQVLVEVEAASLNPFDAKLRAGIMKDHIPLKLPITSAGDFSGTVVDDAGELKAGDKVYGSAMAVSGHSGALAQYLVTSVDQVAIAPANIALFDAAALPLVGVSAWQALIEHMHLQANQKILIHGGSGGIGSVAIQIAKHLGAHVATTASGAGIKLVEQLGANVVIDYKTQRFDELLSEYDAAFDTVGGGTFDASHGVLKRGGVLVSMVAQPDEAKAMEHGIEVIHQNSRVTTDRLNHLSMLVEGGVVVPQIGKTFRLEQASEAFAALESGQVLGKVVVGIR